MDNIAELVDTLFAKDNAAAYAALQALEAESGRSDAVYAYFDRFADMLESGNSYIRSRGLMLLSANARWDKDNKMEGIIDEYLAHICDEKPITSRQCVKLLPNIAAHKPGLVGKIKTALENADLTKYKDTMRPLIQKDILAALLQIL